MPEILEESAQAVCGAGWVGVWRPLLCVIGSARPVAFPMHLHLRCLPQLPSVWKKAERDLERTRRILTHSCVHRESGCTLCHWWWVLTNTEDSKRCCDSTGTQWTQTQRDQRYIVPKKTQSRLLFCTSRLMSKGLQTYKKDFEEFLLIDLIIGILK